MFDRRFLDDLAPGSVLCPACGGETDADIKSLVTPQSAELKALLDGELNRVTCQECGTPFVVATPLLYRDDVDQFFVYYIPLEDRSSWREVEARVGEICDRAFAELAPDERPVCRLTFHRRNFIEKIAAREAGLDDRLLEYVKYQLYNRPVEPIDQIRCELLYDFSNADESKIVFILFDRETGEATAAAHLPMDTYGELDDALQGDKPLEDELEKLFPGPYVSVERLYD
jgi:hypothetical protein